jgi:signal transduction histidine kinase
VLYAFDRQVAGPEFSRDDEQLLESFAASAAMAVAAAQQFTAHGLRRGIEASEAERQRWARELHDQTLQDMAGLRVALSAARRKGTPEALEAVVDDTIDHLAEGINALRAIITDLRPAALDQLGAKAAIEALVERARATPDAPAIDLRVDLDFEEGRASTRQLAGIEEGTYRLVQEAMSNALKHACAGRVDISVVERDGAVHIDVRDDGRGFDTDRDADGFGLIGMHERVALAGGTLDVRSRPGRGTELHAVLPVRRRGDEALAGTA